MDNLQLIYLILYLFVFIFGICIGSFLNVCIYRLPINESLTKKNSHCMTCGTPIRKRDLVPVISWCLLRGKCHACGAKISPRYTVVELLNGIVYLWVYMRYDIEIPKSALHAGLVCLMMSALIVVFFMDWDTQLINTYVVIFIALLAIPDQIFCPHETELTIKSRIIGFFIASVPLLIITLASHEKAMGMGDVYLMAAGGLFVGAKGAVIALLIALVVGSIVGIILKHQNGDSVFAFGPYLSIGIAVAAMYSNQIYDWYINLTGLGQDPEQYAIQLFSMLG